MWLENLAEFFFFLELPFSFHSVGSAAEDVRGGSEAPYSQWFSAPTNTISLCRPQGR